jgi:hypothetical protein
MTLDRLAGIAWSQTAYGSGFRSLSKGRLVAASFQAERPGDRPAFRGLIDAQRAASTF